MYVRFVVTYKLHLHTTYHPTYLLISRVLDTNAANGIRLSGFLIFFFRRYFLGFWIGNSQGLYAHRTIHTQKKNAYIHAPIIFRKHGRNDRMTEDGTTLRACCYWDWLKLQIVCLRHVLCPILI